MNKQSQSSTHETETPTDRKGAVTTAAMDLASESMGAARERLNNAKEKAEEVIEGLRESAADRARNADRAIREHPYLTIAIAAGLGTVIGFLLARGRDSGE